MVLPFLTMPDDVLAHFARQLSDATTAGRLAQTSRAGDRLMRNRLPKLREERQAAAQAAAQAKAAKRRAWCEGHVYDCFEASEDGVHYRCIAGNIAWARHVAPHCVFAVQAKPANCRITYSAATQENTEL